MKVRQQSSSDNIGADRITGDVKRGNDKLDDR
jgi:hypothetical protein